MAAIGISPRDEVIVPAISFVSTANCVVYCGGTPVFADVQADTALIEPPTSNGESRRAPRRSSRWITAGSRATMRRFARSLRKRRPASVGVMAKQVAQRAEVDLETVRLVVEAESLIAEQRIRAAFGNDSIATETL
jgi:DegT/DnrJ/EryC1/StrS aminotransferase family